VLLNRSLSFIFIFSANLLRKKINRLVSDKRLIYIFTRMEGHTFDLNNRESFPDLSPTLETQHTATQHTTTQRTKVKGLKTYKWCFAMGWCPTIVWQYANGEELAVELIMNKYKKLFFSEKINEHLSTKNDEFGVYFRGPFVTLSSLEDFEANLQKEPHQIVEQDMGSGFCCALDG
jgi:hypothetical protein